MTVYKPIKKEDLEKKIKNGKKENIENRLLVTLKSIEAYAAATFKFGKNSETARDALFAKKEFVRVLKEEKQLFKFLLNNLHLMDLEAASEVIKMLDDVRKKTFEYYNDVFQGIDKAAEYGDPKLAERVTKDFDTLTETSSFRAEVVALTENISTVKAFLNFPEDFWKFIEGKCTSIEMTHEGADNMTFVIPISDINGNISTLRMNVPKPTDLYTALKAIQTYIQAYYIYSAIGRPNYVNDEHSINQAKNNYVKYLGHKAKHTIK